MLSKSFRPRCPEIGAKTQSGSIRRLTRRQLDEWACLFGGNADSAQRQWNGIRTLCPFLSEGYKRGIQWPKKVNENGRFSLVNAGIAQLVEQLICNQQVVGSNPTAGSIVNCGLGGEGKLCSATSWPLIWSIRRSRWAAWAAETVRRSRFHPFPRGIGCTSPVKRPIWRISSRRFSCGHNILWTPARSFALREMDNGFLCAAACSDACVV